MTTSIVNQFHNWIKLKIALHFSSRIIYFRERQIWWASFGQNVGSEQNGKNRDFERPILILKKFNAAMLLAVPISSKVKVSKYHYNFVRNNRQYSANLSQVRVLSSKRLLRQVGKMRVLDFHQIKNVFKVVI